MYVSILGVAWLGLFVLALFVVCCATINFGGDPFLLTSVDLGRVLPFHFFFYFSTAFLLVSNRRWHPPTPRIAREKVGQQLREALGNKYKSSHSAKKGRRRASGTKMNRSMEEIVKSNREVSETVAQMSKAIKRSSDPSSDGALMSVFNRANSRILEAIKRDGPLVQRFTEAGRSANNVNNDASSSADNGSANDTDHQRRPNPIARKAPSSWIVSDVPTGPSFNA